MINAIIVDDEKHGIELLQNLLEKYCPEVRIDAACMSGEQGLDAIQQYCPNLIFLDIEMPRMNGFEMLEKADTKGMHIIFTTSYDRYAIKAIRFSAIDYLLKPIDRHELRQAVDRVLNQPLHRLPEQLDLLMQKLNNPHRTVNKIALPTMDGLQLVPVDQILYCTAESNYTVLNLRDKQRLVVSRTLKDITEILEDYNFLRVHNSNLVNLNEVTNYVRGEGGYLILSDGSHVDVSRGRKEELLNRLRPGKA